MSKKKTEGERIADLSKARNDGPALVLAFVEPGLLATLREAKQDAAIPHTDRLYTSDVVHMRTENSPMESGIVARVVAVHEVQRIDDSRVVSLVTVEAML